MRRRTIGITAAAAAVLVAVAGALVATSGDATAGVREQAYRVDGVPEPGDAAPVTLDVSVFTPPADGDGSGRRYPAVLLAHGFGGSKTDLADDARTLAADGYVAVTYTARGFGASGGRIHLDAPDFEVADAQKVLDALATRPDVLLDGPGDPRVGVAGGSYGGALSILLAGLDRRVDAIAPQITWNDLRQALFPQFAVDAATAQATPAAVAPVAPAGVFKRAWAGVFFSPSGSGLSGLSGGAAGLLPGAAPSGAASPGAADDGPAAAPAANACGRFAADLCDMYSEAARTGRPTTAMLDLLWRSSPARVTKDVKAPTLLVQGQADSLFPLSEGDANARAIAATGTPVKVVWEAGGHDGGVDESQRLRDLTLAWFDRYVKKGGSAPDTRFEVTVPDAVVSSIDSNPAPQVRIAPAEPGVTAAGPVPVVRLPLTGGLQVVQAPPGGSPAALTALPGVGGALAGALGSVGGGSALSALPGQVAAFETAPVERAGTVVGGGRVALRVTTTAPDATLFVGLYDVAPGGAATLPRGLVSPVRLELRSGAGPGPAGPSPAPTSRDVTVALPAVVTDLAVGHRLRVVVSTTDQGYALPADGRAYEVALAGDSTLTVPVLDAEVVGGGLRPLLPWALGLVALVAAAVLVVTVGVRRGRRDTGPDPDLADVPLAVRDLGKAYGDGFRAVSDLSFTVEQGRVLGLLGPNGAGKTTTLRMLMGLIAPTEGEIRVFGEPIRFGAPVLSRVGAFVEGPGFLPHLSGLENLHLYWAATGRPAADARFDEALEVAGLGNDVQRRVRTYSQGMRQRLAIAQAMLGLPDLLVLDEPTNGLDPPQIREMREVLGRYAATGRTVVVSSHLLAEVEQTCSHVVVMHQGRLVFEGTVADLVGSATVVVVDVDDPQRAARVAASVEGAQDVGTTPTGIVLRLVGTPRGALVAALVAAGLHVERVAPQRGLEEAFLALVGES